MAIIITSPIAGSLKINNSSASPMNMYLCNLKTVTVNGDLFTNSVNILNSEGQSLMNIPMSKLTTVAASSPGGFSVSDAVDAIASLIIE